MQGMDSPLVAGPVDPGMKLTDRHVGPKSLRVSAFEEPPLLRALSLEKPADGDRHGHDPSPLLSYNQTVLYER
jgi:hypothetical protein